MGPNTIEIKGHKTELFRSRKPEELPWRSVGVTILFETTGAFLTTEAMGRHAVDYVILSAPPKVRHSCGRLFSGTLLLFHYSWGVFC